MNFQLPTQYSRVNYLLDNMHGKDEDLHADLAHTRSNVDGMRDSFEAVVALVLPVCSCAKERNNKYGHRDQISEATFKGRQQSNGRWFLLAQT